MATRRNATLRVAMYAKYFPPRYSGAGQQALNLARKLRERGVEIRFYTERTAEHPEEYQVDGHRVVPFFPATGEITPQPARCVAFSRILRGSAWKPEIFHAHSAFPEASALGFTARLHGLRTVLKVTLLDGDVSDSHGRLLGRVHRRLLRSQSGITAISSEIKRELLHAGVPQDRIVSIPNGVDTELLRPASSDERARARAVLGLPQEATVALFVGILNARKNLDWLLDRWQANAWRERTALVLAGPIDPRADEALSQRVAALSADSAQRVFWKAPPNDMPRIYAAADFLVLPSRSEGMPNVALEAMAAGLPVLISAGSGSRDLLGDGPPAGVEFPLDDAARFDREFGALAADIVRVRELGLASRQRAVAAFSLTAVAGAYHELYLDLLTHGRPTRTYLQDSLRRPGPAETAPASIT